ncbi:MAG: hypothetical protein A2046_07575 [Bacteroidetes bacterium GWA2_30_7]|nr:MAG: hypothetical protein A2046_07575 [Bacteroidetes bacterium GWA2_30_7]
MLNNYVIEIIGYAGSIIVALSMLMPSIIRLRWMILAGNLVFIIYGISINSFPILILNIFNAIVNIVFLYKIYTKEEYFKLFQVRSNNLYLYYILDYHKKDIQHFFPFFEYNPNENTFSLFVLRNMQVAGVIIGTRVNENTFKLDLDFAIPEYRDFKLGKFVFSKKIRFFKEHDFKKFVSIPLNHVHEKYLKKMGFNEDTNTGERLFVKTIV